MFLYNGKRSIRHSSRSFTALFFYVPELTFSDLLTSHHLYTAIDDIDLVELGVGDVGVHVDGVGIAAHLCLGFLYGSLNVSVRCLALEVFQFDDVGMAHISENLMKRTQEDVGIAVLVVELGDWAIIAALACQGESVAMHEGLALLAVTL